MRSTFAIVGATLFSLLAGCGGPPDDVAEAARQSRATAARAREASAPQRSEATAQRETTSASATRTAPRPVAREMPPPAPTLPAPTATMPPAAPDRSTAVMGAGPAPAEAAARAVNAASVARSTPDAQITSRVRSLLAADREVGPLQLDVDTRDGVVTLSGTVPTAASRARASDLAKSVADVKSVNDQLTLVAG